MSFDVFFQGFRNGDAAAGGGDRMRQVLAPFIVAASPNTASCTLSTATARQTSISMTTT